MSEPENRNEDTVVEPNPEVATPEVEVVTPEVTETEVAPTAETPATPEESSTTAVEEKTPESTPAPEVPAAETAVVNPVIAVVNKYLPKKWHVTTAAVVVVVLVLVGLTYMMEQQGRIHTGMFDPVNKYIDSHKAVAMVNDVKITQHDLKISISQISAGAKAQGLDVEDENVKADITAQAIDMLVNTELLKQEAATREIVITDEDVATRLESLTSDVGGIEVLQERMKEFNIDEQTLRRDIRNELTIQTLLDQVFKERDVKVTEQEIAEFYKNAAGTSQDVPPLTDVHDQIQSQLQTSKEQEVVTSFVKELKDSATVEILVTA